VELGRGGVVGETGVCARESWSQAERHSCVREERQTKRMETSAWETCSPLFADGSLALPHDPAPLQAPHSTHAHSPEHETFASFASSVPLRASQPLAIGVSHSTSNLDNSIQVAPSQPKHLSPPDPARPCQRSQSASQLIPCQVPVQQRQPLIS
jgi:hypothetical protein